MIDHFKEAQIFFLVAILNMLAVANIPIEIHKGRIFRAFLSSAAGIAALLSLFAVGLFSNIVLSKYILGI